MKTLLVLSDGETWTEIGGCKIVLIPDTEEAENELASEVDPENVPGAIVVAEFAFKK